MTTATIEATTCEALRHLRVADRLLTGVDGGCLYGLASVEMALRAIRSAEPATAPGGWRELPGECLPHYCGPERVRFDAALAVFGYEAEWSVPADPGYGGTSCRIRHP